MTPSNRKTYPMQGRKSKKVYARAIVALLLVLTWGFATLAGILLFLAPEGRASG